MSLTTPPVLSQANQQPPTPIVKPEIVRELNHFMAASKVIRFTYDSSKIPNGTTVAVFNKKTVGTREIVGEISKEQNGDAIFRLVIEEKNDQTQQQFENNIAGAFIGLKLVGTRKVFSTGKQVAKLPAGHWGALIVETLPQSGTYEVFLSAYKVIPKS